MVNELDRFSPWRRMVTVADVSAFLRDCVDAFGLGFHPDTRGGDYEPPLSPMRARGYDVLMERACHVVGADHLYVLTQALPEWRALLNDTEHVTLDPSRPVASLLAALEAGEELNRPEGATWWPPLSS